MGRRPTLPKSAAQRVLIMSLTYGRPIASVTVVLRTMSRHTTLRIRLWHLMWNACNIVVSVDSKVHVFDP